jgi:hypothetical protein
MVVTRFNSLFEGLEHFLSNPMLNSALATHCLLFTAVEFSHNFIELVHFLDYFVKRVRLELEEMDAGRAEDEALWDVSLALYMRKL